MSFASLPYELRLHIWSLAIEPRHITGVRREMSDGKFKKKQRLRGMDILYETTSTPPPAVMQVCREARQHAPYQRSFTAGTEARWTWVNFDVDIFYVTSVWSVGEIGSHRSDIQRLHIRTDDDESDWGEAVVHLGALRDLKDFTSLREVKIYLEPGDLRWGRVVTSHIFPHCPNENVALVDEGSGLVLTGRQLELVYDWRVYMSFDWDPPDPARLEEQTARLHQGGGMKPAQMYEVD